jgi:two-component system, cell cycle response regulator CtrA
MSSRIKMNLNSVNLRQNVALIDLGPSKSASNALINNISELRISRLSLAEAVTSISAIDDLSSRNLPIVIHAGDVKRTLGALTKIRAANSHVPILIAGDAISGPEASSLLDAGADEVLRGQDHTEEVLSRIKSSVRRAVGNRYEILEAGGLSVNLSTGAISVSGADIHLTSKEQSILNLLAMNHDRVVPRRTIYDALYAFSRNMPFEKSIDVHICNIRKKFGLIDPSAAECIKTVSGRGYMIAKDLH